MHPETQHENPHATPSENARFAKFAARLASAGFSPATQACYASDWWNITERAHRDTGRRFRLDRFGPDEFLLQRAALSAHGVAPATLNRRLAFLRRYATFAAERERALRDVAAGYAAVPFQVVPRRAARALSRTQEERFRAAADGLGPAESALAALLLGTGLRSAEAAALVASDVVLHGATPASVRTRGQRAKVVVLPPRAAERISRLLDRVRPRASDPVFRARGGGPLGEDGVAAMVDRIAREAGVEATPRTLRHTFAVRYLSEHRDDIDGLARALGQSSLAAARAYRSEANAGEPAVRAVRWDALDEESPAPGVRRRRYLGAGLETQRTMLSPSAVVPEHAHREEQITFVLSGRIECVTGDVTVTAGAGEFVHVPGGARHAIRTLGDRPALLITAYTPPRRVEGDAGA